MKENIKKTPLYSNITPKICDKIKKTLSYFNVENDFFFVIMKTQESAINH